MTRRWYPAAATRVVVCLSLASTVATACTPTRSRLQPYRDDAVAAARLAREAQKICACVRGDDDLPSHPFTTDGCSMSPDGNWAACCVEHDIAYWCGGTADERRQADRRLAACAVARHHSKCFGQLVYLWVRSGGVPWEPFPWRWGYGWSGIRGYERRVSGRDAASCFAALPGAAAWRGREAASPGQSDGVIGR